MRVGSQVLNVLHALNGWYCARQADGLTERLLSFQSALSLSTPAVTSRTVEAVAGDRSNRYYLYS